MASGSGASAATPAKQWKPLAEATALRQAIMALTQEEDDEEGELQGQQGQQSGAVGGGAVAYDASMVFEAEVESQPALPKDSSGAVRITNGKAIDEGTSDEKGGASSRRYVADDGTRCVHN